MEPRDYPRGVDCVWLCADRGGRVGAFATGGEGPVPTEALDLKRMPVQEIEPRLAGLPVTGSALMLVTLKRPDDFLDLASRGLFAYDWTDAHRTNSAAIHKYEQVAAPGAPVFVSELPKEMAAVFDGIVLNLSFEEERLIDVTSFLACRSAQ